MTKDEKNPFEDGTPEYQLYANMTGNRRAADAFFADSQRYLKMAEERRVLEGKFAAALEKLTSKEPKP